MSEGEPGHVEEMTLSVATSTVGDQEDSVYAAHCFRGCNEQRIVRDATCRCDRDRTEEFTGLTIQSKIQFRILQPTAFCADECLDTAFASAEIDSVEAQVPPITSA